MTMRDFFEKGYKVICEGMWGDVQMEDLDMIECYEEDSIFSHVDEEKKIAYFEEESCEDYDE